MDWKANFLALPTDKVAVADLLKFSGMGEDEIARFVDTTGVLNLTIERKREFTEFVLAGLAQVSEFYPEILKDLDAVICVSQSFDARMPGVSKVVQSVFDLPSKTICLDFLDGCNGFINGLSVASSMHHEGLHRVLLISGDLNSRLTKKSAVGTKALFGDGVAFSLVEFRDAHPHPLILTFGDSEKVISCNFQDPILEMNGFEVFRFTRKQVPKLVNEFLLRINRSVGDFDMIGLHQASKLVVASVAAGLNLDGSLKGNFACGEIGNLGSGSIPAWLELSKLSTPSQSGAALLVGFGAGLSVGACVINVNLESSGVIYVN